MKHSSDYVKIKEIGNLYKKTVGLVCYNLFNCYPYVESKDILIKTKNGKLVQNEQEQIILLEYALSCSA